MKVLYVKLQNTLYELPCGAVLFCLKLATDLKNNGFVINPYDPCVASKLVKGGFMTVVWRVDDIKLFHKDPFEVTKFSQYLLTIYGNKLKVHRWKIHDYLRMYLGYSETGAVKVLMIKYLQKFLDKFSEEFIGTSSTPTAEHLFQFRG